jgi:hypothetical protein
VARALAARSALPGAMNISVVVPPALSLHAAVIGWGEVAMWIADLFEARAKSEYDVRDWRKASVGFYLFGGQKTVQSVDFRLVRLGNIRLRSWQ